MLVGSDGLQTALFIQIAQDSSMAALNAVQ